MEAATLEAALGPDLLALVRARRVPLLECDSICPHEAAQPTRDTFRLRFADGATLKGRRLPSAVETRRVEAIVGRLDPTRFARVLARRGAALLEAWIEGETLDPERIAAGHLRWAGETLGAVHRLALPEGRQIEATRLFRAWPARLEAQLGCLVEAGALAAADAGALRDLALARAPRDPHVTVVHRDLCPENIVAAEGGRLVIVDNATADVGPADEDLARTFYRWPMRGDERAHFVAAYAALRDPAPFLAHEPFWHVVALAHAAWVRRTRGYARADVPLRRLRDLVRSC